jgi:hypothetical protein
MPPGLATIRAYDPRKDVRGGSRVPTAEPWPVTSRTLARRLYLTLFWSALAFAVGLPAYVLVVRVHDTVVVGRDVACYQRELAAPTAAEKCQVAAGDGDPALWVSKNGWDEHRLGDLRPGDTVLLVLAFVVFAGIPLALLVALRAVYRWLTRPSKEGR